MGWFSKVTGIKTPGFVKKAGEVVGKTTMIGQASKFAKENPGLTAGVLGGLAIPGVAGAIGGAGNSLFGAAGKAGGLLSRLFGGGAGEGGLGGARGLLGGLLGGALGGIAGGLNYEQVNRGLKAHEGALSPFQGDYREQALRDMGSYAGSGADNVWRTTQFGGQGSQRWLAPLMGSNAGARTANQELRPYQGQDLASRAAMDLGPGFQKALDVRADAINKRAAAMGLRNSSSVLSQLGDDATKFTMDAYNSRLGDMERQRQFDYGVGQDIYNSRISDVNRDVDIGKTIGGAYDTGYGIGGRARMDNFNNFTGRLSQGWQDQLALADRIGSLRASRDYARGGIATGALNSAFGAMGIPFGSGGGYNNQVMPGIRG